MKTTNFDVNYTEIEHFIGFAVHCSDRTVGRVVSWRVTLAIYTKSQFTVRCFDLLKLFSLILTPCMVNLGKHELPTMSVIHALAYHFEVEHARKLKKFRDG